MAYHKFDLSRLRDKLVACAADRNEIGGVGGFDLYFFAQAAYCNFDEIRTACHIIAPDIFE